MAGAIYRAEFIVTEIPAAEQPHQKLSDTAKGADTSALAGNGATLGSVTKKILPKLSVAMGVQLAIKSGQFIYNSVNAHNANSALISGDTIAYKHLQNESAVVNNCIGIGSAVVGGAIAGATIGSVVPGLGTAIGAAVGAGVAALSQGVHQLMKLPDYEENKRNFEADTQIERVINNLDRERFGTNARTYR